MAMSRLIFAPYDPHRDFEATELFAEYPHKDFQLRSIGVAKDPMARYLEKTLTETGTQTICLREEGRLVGLIALQELPWMSEHFGIHMYAVRHILARSDGPLVHARLLRFVIEEMPEVDFLDCRVAVDDIYAAHALELCGFRYVGTEVYLGRGISCRDTLDPHLPPGIEIRACRSEETWQVIDIVGQTHVHNRFVYDPVINERSAASMYQRLASHCFDAKQFRVLVACSAGRVDGFIISKTNPVFSEIVGIHSGSLDFIGVRPDARARGLGVALNMAAMRDMAERGATYVAVRTLASNYHAQRILFRSGFKVTSSSLNFHRWIQRPKVSAPAAKNAQSCVVAFS